MPGPTLIRKLLIYAVWDGLILQPTSPVQSRNNPAIKIAWRDGAITSVVREGKDGEEMEREAGKAFESWGVVGLLTLSQSSYLISITGREQVAQIQGRPIYAITEVALTSLTSKPAADTDILRTMAEIKKRASMYENRESSDSEDGDGDELATTVDDVDDHVGGIGAGVEEDRATVEEGEGEQGRRRRSTIVEDVIARKGGYGRFAQKWFSKKGWTVDQRRNMGMTANEVNETNAAPSFTKDIVPEIVAASENDKNKNISDASMVTTEKAKDAQEVKGEEIHNVAANLLPKLLRTAQILFGSSRSFYYAYDIDITRSLAQKQAIDVERPLHTQVDARFFWNKHSIQPFINAGQSAVVLPLMQGFVGQRSFEMDSNPPKQLIGMEGEGGEDKNLEMVDMSADENVESLPIGEIDRDVDESNKYASRDTNKTFLLTLVSRRSVKRAGLRYLRRGIDDEGNTANSVETEQILSDPSWDPSKKTYSFVQIRGSIPVFFSQSPYSFKPVPQLHHSEEMNFKAFQTHISRLSDIYGQVQIASLVEKHGPEAIVGEAYQKYAKQLNESKADGLKAEFEWFDFHAICRGMKFENVSLLIESLSHKLDEFGTTIEIDGKLESRQCGVLRTNCMDCLDRTNVVQSACGRRALELQLKMEGIDMSLQADLTTSWFNGVWADNGDAISKQYASTAALKGDFTRTRKRDFQGAIKDMGLSISRFYSGIINDYFSQAAIDFLLGNVTSLVFSDFEANLSSSDPGISMHKLRQQAIEMCHSLVIADETEELVGGWTLLTPQASNTIKSNPFEEIVLLLTNVAIYACRFDWTIEKVSSFERIGLRSITTIKYGVYITATLSATQADEEKNVGLVITYLSGKDDIMRVNSRAMSNIRTRGETDLLDGSAAATSYNPSTLLPFQNLIAGTKPNVPTTRVLALKALPSQTAVAATGSNDVIVMSERELVKSIVHEVTRMVSRSSLTEAEQGMVAEEGDIITLAEARKSTGLMEQLSHSLKKLVWA